MPFLIDIKTTAQALLDDVGESGGAKWIMAARLSFPAGQAPASELSHPVPVHVLAAVHGREHERIAPRIAELLQGRGRLPLAMRQLVDRGEDTGLGDGDPLDLTLRVETGGTEASGESLTANLRLASGRAHFTGVPKRATIAGPLDSRFTELSVRALGQVSGEGVLARALAGPGECASCALRALHIALASPLPQLSPWILGAAVDPGEATVEEYASRVGLGGHAYGALFMRTPSESAVGLFLEQLAAL